MNGEARARLLAVSAAGCVVHGEYRLLPYLEVHRLALLALHEGIDGRVVEVIVRRLEEIQSDPARELDDKVDQDAMMLRVYGLWNRMDGRWTESHPAVRLFAYNEITLLAGSMFDTWPNVPPRANALSDYIGRKSRHEATDFVTMKRRVQNRFAHWMDALEAIQAWVETTPE